MSAPQVRSCESCNRLVNPEEDEGSRDSMSGGYFCATCINDNARSHGYDEFATAREGRDLRGTFEEWWCSCARKHCEEGREEFWKELLHLAWEKGAAEARQQYAELLAKETP